VCIIVMAICMLIFGLIAIVRGQFVLTRAKVVRGVPARIIGVILLLPVPLWLGGALLLGAFYALQGKQPRPEDLEGPATLLTVGSCVGCMVIAVIIGLATAQPMKKKRLPDDLGEDYDRRFGEDDYRPGEGPEPDGLRPPEDRIRE
jgi:drug/metabolite transporter (DMT)-like permease